MWTQLLNKTDNTGSGWEVQYANNVGRPTETLRITDGLTDGHAEYLTDKNGKLKEGKKDCFKYLTDNGQTELLNDNLTHSCDRQTNQLKEEVRLARHIQTKFDKEE